MNPTPIPHLAELEELRGNPSIIYASSLTDDSLRMLYECLRKLGRTDRLDLVLSTSGGSVTTSRQVVILLREYTQHLTILVPYRARSAGTLLCLGADELVLGPMAELGPIDSHVSSVGQTPSDAPEMISSEDIRVFRQMAEDWFGVNRDEDRLQVLALIAQRVFPTSLSSFYRFDKLVRSIADELLSYQLPCADISTRQRIVDQLVAGYHAHDYVLSRTEAKELGLRVGDMSPREEHLLWELNRAHGAQAAEYPGGGSGETVGLIASNNFQARQAIRRIVPHTQKRRWFQRGRTGSENGLNVNWEIDT